MHMASAGFRTSPCSTRAVLRSLKNRAGENCLPLIMQTVQCYHRITLGLSSTGGSHLVKLLDKPAGSNTTRVLDLYPDPTHICNTHLEPYHLSHRLPEVHKRICKAACLTIRLWSLCEVSIAQLPAKRHVQA